MKNIYSFFLIAFLSVNAFAQTPDWLWAKWAGGTKSDGASCVTKDPSGNIIVIGYFSSPYFSFGNVSTTLTPLGYLADNMFIAKYDPLGNLLWVKSGGIGYANSVATDASGNIIMVGSFGLIATFGSLTLNSTGGTDVFIVKYDPSGNVLWVKSKGGINDDEANSVTVDSFGDFIMVGNFKSPSIGFGAGILTNDSVGTKDIFIVKYDGDGNVLWEKSEGGNSDDQPNSVTSDASGNIIIAGYFKSQELVFDTDTLANYSYAKDMFIVKYNSSGTKIWAKSYGGFFDEEFKSISCDAIGNILVTGYFASNFPFGANNLICNGSYDMLIAKYDSIGGELWVKSVGGTDFEFANSITSDVFGNLIVVGSFKSPSITFGTTTLVNAGGYDIFVVKYDQSGTVLWTKSVGGTSNDLAASVVGDILGNIIVVGGFESYNLKFGVTILSSSLGGGNDINMFVAKLSVDNVGINESQFNNSFVVFPNPTIGEFTIILQTTNAEITVADILGQQIIRTQTADKTARLQLEQNGVYIVYIKTKQGTEATKLIVSK